MACAVHMWVHWEKHNCERAKMDSFSLKIEGKCVLILKIKTKIIFWINPSKQRYLCQNLNIFHCFFLGKKWQICFTFSKPPTIFCLHSSVVFPYHVFMFWNRYFHLEQSYSLFHWKTKRISLQTLSCLHYSLHYIVTIVLSMILLPTVGLPRRLSGKEATCQCRRCVQSLGRDPLEKGVATHSSTPF